MAIPLAAISWFYVVVPSSLLWAWPYASWLAQTRAQVGWSEADVRAALGPPDEVLMPGEGRSAWSRREVEQHALVYYKSILVCGNFIVVYIGEDGAVTCSVATTVASD